MIKKKQSEDKSNGNGSIPIEETLQAILANQQEISERLDDVEKQDSAAGKAQLLLTNLTFDTPDNRILEYSDIPPQACEMFATSITLEHIFDPRVQSGEIPLSAIWRYEWARARRAISGKQWMRATALAKEQVEAVKEDNELSRMDMGAPK